MGRRGPQPDYAKREAFAKLIAEGVSSQRASLIVGIHPTTGKRWRIGRKVKSGGRMLDLPAVINSRPEKRYSPRYLSEDERIRLADLRPRNCRSARSPTSWIGHRRRSAVSCSAAATPLVGTDRTRPTGGRSLVVVCVGRAGCAKTTCCATGSRRS